MRWRYSRWDGTQALAGVDPEALMDALSDDLMDDTDFQTALQHAVRRGMRTDGEARLPGMDDLLQSLRTQRQEELQRYNLDTILQDIRNRLEDVLETEQKGIESRLNAASDHGVLVDALQTVAERKQSFLQAIPDDSASAVTLLSEYEFLDDGAREKFRALTEMLERHMLQHHFQSMERLLGGLAGEELEGVKMMLHELNHVLREHVAGNDLGFEEFMQRHGSHFDGASTARDLVEQMRHQATHTDALMASMSPEMRAKLDAMMARVLRDHVLREELTRVCETLDTIAPRRSPLRDYPFSGDASLSLEEALQVMHRLHDLDELERSMQFSNESGDSSVVDHDQVGRVMGPAAQGAVDQLTHLADVLEQAGYIQGSGPDIELTARAIRRIGQRALREIFGQLKRDAFGDHPSPVRGHGGDRSEDTKRYEFGDPFTLDLHATLMNAVARRESRCPAGIPLCLAVEDFEVHTTEQLTQAATVLMLDMSRSMPLRGCFVAAKKVVLALDTLIRLKFPRDHLYIVGFSDYARQLRPESLHGISWSDYVNGTNMQHGLMLARKLLGRHAHGAKQVILITDGEPTAHMEGGRVHFAYPPTFRTFQETLREVKRCTREGIVINTFMLERSHYLADFVTQMTRINGGRAFFASPERLGDYVLVDYVRSRQRLTSTH